MEVSGYLSLVLLFWLMVVYSASMNLIESRRKRKRGQLELGDAASSGVEERSDESSDTVESGMVSKAVRGDWGRTVRLEETDKFYQVVTCQEALPQRDSPRVGGGVAFTAVHKAAQGPRSRAFQMRGQFLAAARGADGGNAKFAWYGAPSADVAAAVEHGSAGRTVGSLAIARTATASTSRGLSLLTPAQC